MVHMLPVGGVILIEIIKFQDKFGLVVKVLSDIVEGIVRKLARIDLANVLPEFAFLGSLLSLARVLMSSMSFNTCR